jgi:hypothetical protein
MRTTTNFSMRVFMKVWILGCLLLFNAGLIGQVTNPVTGGGPPSGPCGGDTGGTYPNCTVVGSHIATGGAAFTAPVTITSTGSPLLLTSTTSSGFVDANGLYCLFTGAGNCARHLGQQDSPGNGIYEWFAYTSNNNAANGYRAAINGSGTNYLSVFPNNHMTLNGNTDLNHVLSVVGDIYAPIYLTPNTFVGRSQTAALNQTIVASASTAAYRISMATNCKTAVAAASYTSTVSYTDTSNTVQTIASGAVVCTTLGTATQSNAITVANVLSGTPISLATTTSGAVSYDVAVTVEQVTSN